MPLIIGLLVGLTVLVAGYEMLPLRRASAETQLRQVAGVQEELIPLSQALVLPLAGVLGRVMPSATIRSLERKLFWAHFQGRWMGWNGAMVYALTVALGCAGLLIGVVTGNMLFGLLAGTVGVLLPQSGIVSATKRALREVQRALPDLAERLSLGVVGGSTVETALREVAGQYPGLLGEFLRRAELESRSRGKRFLEVVRTRAEESGLPEMMSLFVKLEEIERQGVDAAARLAGLSRDMFREYQTAVKERVRGLGGKLSIPLMVFFVLPFIVLCVAPLMANVLALMR